MEDFVSDFFYFLVGKVFFVGLVCDVEGSGVFKFIEEVGFGDEWALFFDGLDDFARGYVGWDYEGEVFYDWWVFGERSVGFVGCGVGG